MMRLLVYVMCLGGVAAAHDESRHTAFLLDDSEFDYEEPLPAEPPSWQQTSLIDANASREALDTCVAKARVVHAASSGEVGLELADLLVALKSPGEDERREAEKALNYTKAPEQQHKAYAKFQRLLYRKFGKSLPEEHKNYIKEVTKNVISDAFIFDAAGIQICVRLNDFGNSPMALRCTGVHSLASAATSKTLWLWAKFIKALNVPNTNFRNNKVNWLLNAFNRKEWLAEEAHKDEVFAKEFEIMLMRMQNSERVKLEFPNSMRIQATNPSNPPYQPVSASRFLICMGPKEDLLAAKTDLSLCTGLWSQKVAVSTLGGLAKQIHGTFGTVAKFDDVAFNVRFELLWGDKDADRVKTAFKIGSGGSTDFVKMICAFAHRRILVHGIRCCQADAKALGLAYRADWKGRNGNASALLETGADGGDGKLIVCPYVTATTATVAPEVAAGGAAGGAAGAVFWPILIAVIVLSLLYVGYRVYKWYQLKEKMGKWNKLVESSTASMGRSSASLLELAGELSQAAAFPAVGGAVMRELAKAVANAAANDGLLRLAVP